MSDRMQLIIGNYNYSSWSLRAWLALRHMGIEFDVVRIPLDTPEFPAQVRAWSAAARVPVLKHGALTVWDSLAICEYGAEHSGRGWPQAQTLRFHARCAVAEMHAGFAGVRSALPMNVRARRRVHIGDDLQEEIDRLAGLWCEALTLHDGSGGWLYGERSIADAFFAPVALRLRSYGIGVPELCQPWLECLFNDPDMIQWCAAAEQESEVLEREEVGADVTASAPAAPAEEG